jgi:hypothetical protein
VFDLATPQIPRVYVAQNDVIRDVAFTDRSMLAMMSSGAILTQLLSSESADGGPLVLREQLVCAANLRGRVGSAIHYSLPCRLLFAAYADGRCFGLSINDEATEVCGGFALHSTRTDAPTGGSAAAAAVASKGLAAQHFQDVPGERGLLLATSRKSLMPLAIRIAPSSVAVQLVRQPSLGFAAARDVAPASPPVCWFLAEDGSLHCYEGSSVSVSGGGGGGGGGGGPGTEAELREQEVAAGIAASFAKRAQTKLPSFPVDFFERAVCVSQQGDDIGFSSSSIAEGLAEHVRAFDATAKTRLSSSSEDYVTSLNKSTALDLVVHNSNHTSVVVGVRVLLGNAQPSAIPATITLFGRSVATQESQRRWYDLPFTPAESVVGAKQFNLHFSSAHSGVGPAVDAVEVYAQSKAEFGWDKQLSALALKYVPHSAASQAHSTEPSAPHATLLRALEAALQQLETFHRLASAGVGIGAAAPVRDDMLRSLPLMFTATSKLASLRRPAKQLLRLLQPDPSSYHELKDMAQLRYAFACVSSDRDAVDKGVAAPLTLLLLEQQAAVLKKLAKKRPQHLFGFLQRHTTFLPDFCAAFRELGVRGQPTQLTQLTHSLVQLLFDLAQHAVGAVGVDAAETEQLDAMQPAFDLLVGMLLGGVETVRFTTSAALSRLLLSVTVDGAPPTVASSAAKEGCAREEMDVDDDEAAGPAEVNSAAGAVQFCCDVCGVCPIVGSRWHCAICKDFDLCTACYDAGKLAPLPPHTLDHPLSRIRIVGTEPGTQPAAEGDDTEGDDNAEGDDTEGDNTEGDELSSLINDDVAAQPAAVMDSDCEDEMLAMAVAMSLGKEPVTASDPPPSVKSPPQMAMLFLEAMTRHLPHLTSHDGLGVLPYLQLLQLLATQQVAAGASARQWMRLADAILAVIAPVKEAAVAVGKRTPRLELHTLLLMLLCLLLQKESRAAAVSVREVEQPDVRALQTELVAHLRAAGLGELLYAHALKLFDHLKEAGAKELSNEAASCTPGGTNVQVHARLARHTLPIICPRCGRHYAPPVHALLPAVCPSPPARTYIPTVFHARCSLRGLIAPVAAASILHLCLRHIPFLTPLPGPSPLSLARPGPFPPLRPPLPPLPHPEHARAAIGHAAARPSRR